MNGANRPKANSSEGFWLGPHQCNSVFCNPQADQLKCQIRIAATAVTSHSICLMLAVCARSHRLMTLRPSVEEHAMITRLDCIAGASVLGLFVAVTAFLYPGQSSRAFAQASDMAGIARTESVSARAVVKTVDLQTRKVTLETSSGNTIILKVGDQVQNLPQVRPGDTVIAHYYASVAYVLTPSGTKLPDDSLTVAGARAAPGEKPGGALGSKIVVTGLVVSVDPTLHTISLVDPSGGVIRSVDVVTSEGQQNMKLIKIGDTITAVITEAVLVGVEPAP
jgi:Cu/Ag efflux protein CusF